LPPAPPPPHRDLTRERVKRKLAEAAKRKKQSQKPAVYHYSNATIEELEPEEGSEEHGEAVAHERAAAWQEEALKLVSWRCWRRFDRRCWAQERLVGFSMRLMSPLVLAAFVMAGADSGTEIRFAPACLITCPPVVSPLLPLVLLQASEARGRAARLTRELAAEQQRVRWVRVAGSGISGPPQKRLDAALNTCGIQAEPLLPGRL
jgi:hypothetical protein